MRGLVTGIGSLPYKEPEKALEVIFKYMSEIPFWPQLPKRSIYESMVIQFSEGFDFLKLKDDHLILEESEENKLSEFYEYLIKEDIEHFRITERYASGLESFYNYLKKIELKQIKFIKLQITGPFTFCGSIQDKNKISLLHNPSLRQAILEGLIMKAKWQIKKFREFNKELILFIDEPYLSCFGSGYTPLNREEVIKDLEEFTTRLHSKDLFLGVHCCANTDWSIFMQIPYLKIINFDAYGFLDQFLLYPQELNSFLKKGGIIAWGIVPTQLVEDKFDAEFFLKKINKAKEYLVKKGVDKEILEKNTLLTPSCGLGSTKPEEVEEIFSLLTKISDLIKKGG